MLLLSAAMGIGAGVYIKLQPIPEDAAYVGSTECQSCHSGEHAGWFSSLHTKMMRRVDEPGVVVADLENNPDLPFDANETVWAIGGKWEQQFMGEEGGTETLLPGVWMVAGEKWKQKGWDGWQEPVPLRRCHGCHAVGLDVETGKFVESNVGCESCHGPGSWHVKTLGIGKIFSNLDAQICGQCHTRGKSTDGKYFFPVNYRPGRPLNEYFVETTPHPGQNSSQWWGNGHARKRHQEYYSWRQEGGHADSLKSIKEDYDGRYGEVTSNCLGCHAGEAAAAGKEHDFSPEEVKQGITCAVCHNVHGELDQPRMECKNCHDGGAFYHQQEANASHVPCLMEANVECIQCHMPLTGKNGGDYTLHSHTPGIIPPGDTHKYGVPNSCANGGCHKDQDTDWLNAAYEQHYSQ